MSRYQDWITKHAYFKSKDAPLKDYWVRLRGIARQKRLSSKALEHLEWIIFYFTVGSSNASEVAKYFGISRKTFYKWLGRFNGKNLLTLEEKSKAPQKTRNWEVTREEEERIIFTAIEEIAKIGFARVYTTNSSGYGEDFLKRLMYLAQGKVEVIHSDNGSEFKDKFEKACQNLGIVQAYSRPRTPTDNPALERFNWTVQDEWLELSEVGLDDINDSNLDLTNWLVEYNKLRPHEARLQDTA